MKKTLKAVTVLAVGVLAFTSCASRHDLLYLTDMEELTEYPVVQKYEAIIHRDDRLRIIVSAKDPALALPFNMPGTGGYTIDAQGNITTTPAAAGGNDKNKQGYLVDINGDIDFPILGKLHVEGLSRSQLTNMIKNELVTQELLKDPIVMVDFLNFKFTVLGEVGGKGTYEVDGDRITLLEAIARHPVQGYLYFSLLLFAAERYHLCGAYRCQGIRTGSAQGLHLAVCTLCHHHYIVFDFLIC